MEFFARLESAASADTLQEQLELDRLPRYCESIYGVENVGGGRGDMDCLWGVFEVRRDEIRGGVRFILPGCPNAFSWTVTTGLDPDPAQVVVHATINRETHDPDFIESIEDFVEGWRAGLQRELSGSA